jgi:hypothetical protein
MLRLAPHERQAAKQHRPTPALLFFAIEDDLAETADIIGLHPLPRVFLVHWIHPFPLHGFSPVQLYQSGERAAVDMSYDRDHMLPRALDLLLRVSGTKHGARSCDENGYFRLAQWSSPF